MMQTKSATAVGAAHGRHCVPLTKCANQATDLLQRVAAVGCMHTHGGLIAYLRIHEFLGRVVHAFYRCPCTKPQKYGNSTLAFLGWTDIMAAQNMPQTHPSAQNSTTRMCQSRKMHGPRLCALQR